MKKLLLLVILFSTNALAAERFDPDQNCKYMPQYCPQRHIQQYHHHYQYQLYPQYYPQPQYQQVPVYIEIPIETPVYIDRPVDRPVYIDRVETVYQSITVNYKGRTCHVPGDSVVEYFEKSAPKITLSSGSIFYCAP